MPLYSRKTRNTSIRLYNKGLEQAKSRDLTGAIKSLEQSILFDKTIILHVIYWV